MAKVQKKQKGGQRKHGREARRPSHVRYNSNRRRDKNKAKRILKSNGGEKALTAWKLNKPMPRTKRGPLAKQHRKIGG